MSNIGWERERRVHFDEITELYDKVRPEYPRALYEDLFKYVGGGKTALEIGAGTGKATRPFLDAGYDVTAVEIGENMTEFLRCRYQDNTNFSAITAAFEDVAPLENNYDLIYAATAFHWVDAKIGGPKAFSLLKSGGTFALFRYNFIPADGDELYEEIQDVYKEYGHQPYKRPTKMSITDFSSADGIYWGFRCKSLESYGFSDTVMKFYDFSRVFDADGYIKSLETNSDHRSLPDDKRAALYVGIRSVINRHGGSIKLNYMFQLYMGKKP